MLFQVLGDPVLFTQSARRLLSRPPHRPQVVELPGLRADRRAVLAGVAASWPVAAAYIGGVETVKRSRVAKCV